MITHGLTYTDLRAAQRREVRKRFADRAWLFLLGAAAGAALILVFVA